MPSDKLTTIFSLTFLLIDSFSKFSVRKIFVNIWLAGCFYHYPWSKRVITVVQSIIVNTYIPRYHPLFVWARFCCFLCRFNHFLGLMIGSSCSNCRYTLREKKRSLWIWKSIPYFQSKMSQRVCLMLYTVYYMNFEK